jgi:hypothetical protein
VGDAWRYYRLTLDDFDDATASLALLTQYKSRAWKWTARYRVKRSPEADKELGIPQILQERAEVIGGVKWGMAVRDVLAKKGKHYKVSHHAMLGSADLIYDDVKVSVRDWFPGTDRGWVVRVEPTTEQMKESLKDRPYEDQGTSSVPVDGAVPPAPAEKAVSPADVAAVIA